ncbi:MAG: hypothetical protein AAGB31_08685 [Bdellovibrio sp.]
MTPLTPFIYTFLTLLNSPSQAGSLTISGISSGGFMASQMGVIYSHEFSGVATVAGGVYYCAQNHFYTKSRENGLSSYFSYSLTEQGVSLTFNPLNLSAGSAHTPSSEDPEKQDEKVLLAPLPSNPIYQATQCMSQPETSHSLPPYKSMNLSFLDKLEDAQLIAPLTNISKQRVLIYQGENDVVVKKTAAFKLQEFYARMGVPDSQVKVIFKPGNHNFPSDGDYGISCADAKVPYVARCNFDLAGDILQHTLGRTLERSSFQTKNLYRVQQKEAPVSIAPSGYLYANEFCLNNPQECDLHVALHGCQMADDYDQNFQNFYSAKIRLTRILGISSYELNARVPIMGAQNFARYSGYASYAEPEKNHLMIYFPQTQITAENYPANPNGCWDWYGWTGEAYATNQGVETSWLMHQIQSVRQNPRSLILTP